jgi:hypothetical protein
MTVDLLFAALNNAFMPVPKTPKSPGKDREATEIEQVVSRSLRESLEVLQRTTEELNQSLNDLTAACASARPSRALSPILRAQTAAASVAASLEVLSRFLAVSLQAVPLPAGLQRALTASEPQPASSDARPQRSDAPDAISGGSASHGGGAEMPWQPPEAPNASEERSAPGGAELATPGQEVPAPAAFFDISRLLPEEQDLHRRANRVAKVSMQDIKMLRPDDLRLGKEHKDICLRLRDDIEKAHKEYDRRFQSILGHPVDYFYNWMVEILGDGDPEALGEYPYPSPVSRH